MQFTAPSGAKRPAWGSWYNVNTNQATAMGVTSNTFCAGGMSTADGSWAVYGYVSSPQCTLASHVPDLGVVQGVLTR